MLADATHSTVRLLSTGPIAGWAGLLLFAAATAFVIWQLRRDLAGINPTRLTRWVLPSLRLGIVALFARLRPCLSIQREVGF